MSSITGAVAGIGRRQIIKAVTGAGLLHCLQGAQAEPAWRPTSPVKLVVPYPPGGPADLLARLTSASLAEQLGQPVVVDNKPGATGTIGSEIVYRARPDGTTLLVGVLDPLSSYPHLIKGSPIDVTRFEPVAGLASTALLLVGRPDLPADNLQELLGLARTQSLSYASAGTGSGPHMLTLLFARAAKIAEPLHVPFAGASPALNALMAKQVDIAFVGVGAAMNFQSRLKVYGVSSATPVPALPGVPTLIAQGLPVVGESWQGILAPPRTPLAATTELSRLIQDSVQSPAFQANVIKQGMTPIVQTQKQFASYYLDEYRRWGDLVRQENVRLD